MATEFDLIQRYFTRPALQSELGVGDDAALIKPSLGKDIAVSTDMLVAGTHFRADVAPYKLGWKTLAVNVSDMAAMGAQPCWATLAIALPKADEAWIAEFAKGFFACADAFQIDLIGGDTTRGPLTLSVTIMGKVPLGKALRRDGAKLGDEIWVSGKLGEAAIALGAMQGRIALTEAEFSTCRVALEQPQPRVTLGLALRDIANSAIDISDGLLADLGHILERSQLGAEIQLASIPCSTIVSSRLPSKLVQKMLLAGGDDYELCFTAPAKNHDVILNLSQQLALPLTCIGSITSGTSVIVHDANHQPISIKETGFDHFA
jgi:thiamine-monophosphate kinase